MTVTIVSVGDWFGRTGFFDGATADHIRLGGEEAPLPLPGISCDIRRSDIGFVLIPHPRAGSVRVNGKVLDGPCVLHSEDQIMAGGAVVLWTESVVREATGNARPAPREEGLSSVYQGLKKLFRKLGLFRTAEPIP